jgi:hypothetical protein
LIPPLLRFRPYELALLFLREPPTMLELFLEGFWRIQINVRLNLGRNGVEDRMIKMERLKALFD